MSDMRASEVAEATAVPVLEIGTAWMMDSIGRDVGAAYGLPGRVFWAVGRGGVLGDVDADVVGAAFGFVAPKMMRDFWEQRPAELAPREAAARFAEAACAFGRQRLAGVDEARLDRLAVLAGRVAEASSPAVGALFAGWRRVPCPERDGASRAVLALHVLREHRGGAHIAAFVASGLQPVQSIMAAPGGRGGEGRAERFGWERPYPDPAPFVEARTAIEVATT
ncbi:MAG: hypothetical protein OEY23_23865, partial [Acidimicrobiia bacterium]|nr:hypothetical protein [Acidimicrobiia bacterium]